MKILLTDGSHMNALAILRRLKGHEIHLIHHKKSAPAYSKYCEKLIICPPITREEAYAEFLIQHVKNNKYDILMPVGILAFHICSKYYDQLSQFVRVEIAAYDNLKIALNKTETYKFCERHGIPHPKTYHDLENVKFPAIIKGAGEVKGKFTVRYVNNSDELNNELEIIRKKYPYLQQEDLVIQEQIVGEPYGFFCL